MDELRLFNTFSRQKREFGNTNSTTCMSKNMENERNCGKSFSPEISEMCESLQKGSLNGPTTVEAEQPINLECKEVMETSQFPRVDYIQPATEPQNGKDTRHTNQTAYLYAEVIEKLWDHEWAWIFTEPVNATAWGIQDYYEKVRDPIDLGTIRKRLLNKYYFRADECIRDIRKMFSNCYDYNGPDHDLVPRARAFQEEFEKKFQTMPKMEYEVDSIGPIRKRSNVGCHKKRRATLFQHPKKKLAPATSCTKSKKFSTTRMKKSTEAKTKNVKKDCKITIDSNMDGMQLENCASILDEMLSDRHASYAWPFYGTDRSTILGVIDYKDIIEKPIDLTTIGGKLTLKTYRSHEEFAEDMRRMISNLYRFQNFANYVSITLARKFQSEFEILYRKMFPYHLGTYSFDWLKYGSDNGIQPPFNAGKDIEKLTYSIDRFLKGKKRTIPEQSYPNFLPEKKKYKKRIPKSVIPRDPSKTLQDMEIASATLETSTGIELLESKEEKIVLSDSEPETDIAFDYIEYNDRRLLSLDIHKLQDVDLVNALKVVPKEEQIFDDNGSVTLDLEKMSSQTIQRLKRYVKNCRYPARPKLKNLPEAEAVALKCQWLESKLKCIDSKLSPDEDVKTKETKDEDIEMVENVGAFKSIQNHGSIAEITSDSDSDSEGSMSDSSSSDSACEGIDQNEVGVPETD